MPKACGVLDLPSATWNWHLSVIFQRHNQRGQVSVGSSALLILFGLLLNCHVASSVSAQSSCLKHTSVHYEFCRTPVRYDVTFLSLLSPSVTLTEMRSSWPQVSYSINARVKAQPWLADLPALSLAFPILRFCDFLTMCIFSTYDFFFQIKRTEENVFLS